LPQASNVKFVVPVLGDVTVQALPAESYDEYVVAGSEPVQECYLKPTERKPSPEMRKRGTWLNVYV
jgi:hypothetical protein